MASSRWRWCSPCWWALALPGWQTGLLTAWTAAAVLHFGWACSGFLRMRARWAVPLGAVGMMVGAALYVVIAGFVIGVGVGVSRAALGG